MKAKEFIIELKKQSKPRNFVAKNASLAGKAGQHKDKKKAEKQGDTKHKNKEYADEGVLSFLKTEPAPKKKWDPAKDSRATSNKNNDDSWVKLLIDKHRRGIPLTDREWNSIEQWKLKRAMRGEDAEIQELSTDLLGRYKKAAGADAKKADADGNYTRGDKRFKGINKATNKQFDNDLKKHGQQGVAERVRDPEDWDEGNTEPPNNFAVYINGKKWKVFKGRGRYADDQREQAHYQQLKDWAAKKSVSSGKQWTVSITGETATESLDEVSWKGIKQGAAAAGLAGAMAFGAGSANARVTPDGQGGYTGGFKPTATVTAPSDNKSAAEAPKGYSKEYLQKAANPDRFGRYMISVEKAQELLKQMDSKVGEGSMFAGAKVGHKEGPAGQWRNDGTKKNKPAKPGDLVGDGM